MEAIRRQVRADDSGALHVTGLSLKPGETVDVLITAPTNVSQRKVAIAEMSSIMDEAGAQAARSGLDENELERVLGH
jgi:hypothetical protein